jgi:hypothetical protein
VKRHSNKPIIPKIILFLGIVSVLGIILLFLPIRRQLKKSSWRPQTRSDHFAQVIRMSTPKLLKIWENGSQFYPNLKFNCPSELVQQSHVGDAYTQCNPHFWQCYWQGGIIDDPMVSVELDGQNYHVVATPVFKPVDFFSSSPRFIEFWHSQSGKRKYGYLVELRVQEIPGVSIRMLLGDSCRDSYLPERIYATKRSKSDELFHWDNFGRSLFIDKFYVSNRDINQWRLHRGETHLLIPQRDLWPMPALLNQKDQIQYCHFLGKKLLESKLMDAASMTPENLKDPMTSFKQLPSTPWQRDFARTFLGMAKINPDYQLTPLDCALAEVKGCKETFYSTDSASWMGFNYALGFHQESLVNDLDPDLNLKPSSRLIDPGSPWHKLGHYKKWSKLQNPESPVAFRCYEEVLP